jgi:hypothetical protein
VGEHCEHALGESSECRLECKNGGVCTIDKHGQSTHGISDVDVDIDGDGNERCLCMVGFEGRLCEKKYQQCGNGRCYHGGMCVKTMVGNHLPYSCDCSSARLAGMAYTGPSCEVKTKIHHRFLQAESYENVSSEGGGTDATWMDGTDAKGVMSTEADPSDSDSTEDTTTIDEVNVSTSAPTSESSGPTDETIANDDADTIIDDQLIAEANGGTEYGAVTDKGTDTEDGAYNDVEEGGDTTSDTDVDTLTIEDANSDPDTESGVSVNAVDSSASVGTNSSSQSQSHSQSQNQSTTHTPSTTHVQQHTNSSAVTSKTNSSSSVHTSSPSAPTDGVDSSCALKCQNGGSCQYGVKTLGILAGVANSTPYLNQTHSENYEHCACLDGFVGLRCEHKIEVCGDGKQFCLHGGKCLLNGQVHSCDCASASFQGGNATGSYCQHGTTEICSAGDRSPGHVLSFCVNRGSCIRMVSQGES